MRRDETALTGKEIARSRLFSFRFQSEAGGVKVSLSYLLHAAQLDDGLQVNIEGHSPNSGI